MARKAEERVAEAVDRIRKSHTPKGDGTLEADPNGMGLMENVVLEKAGFGDIVTILTKEEGLSEEEIELRRRIYYDLIHEVITPEELKKLVIELTAEFEKTDQIHH